MKIVMMEMTVMRIIVLGLMLVGRLRRFQEEAVRGEVEGTEVEGRGRWV